MQEKKGETALKASYIAVGLVLMVIAYGIYQISVPWIEWTGNFFPTPTLTQKRLLEPIAYICAGIGFIVLIFGLTENSVLRIIFGFSTAIIVFLFAAGIISIETLQKFIEQIKLEV